VSEKKKLDSYLHLITSVSWSPIGNKMASGGENKYVRVKCLKQGKSIGLPYNEKFGVFSIRIFQVKEGQIPQVLHSVCNFRRTF
jgi:WD40 repeat protein